MSGPVKNRRHREGENTMAVLNELNWLATGAALMIAGALARQGMVAEVTLKVVTPFRRANTSFRQAPDTGWIV